MTFDRREYLRLLGASGVAGGLLSVGAGAGAGAGASSSAPIPSRATVTVDPADATEWTVDDRIFGRFLEHNGRDVYPGVYADHVANGSFEVWNRSEAESRTAVLYRDTPRHEGVAYPWEPSELVGRVAFDQEVGGTHGRRPEPDLERGAGVPPDKRPDPAGVTRSRYQRVSVEGSGAGAERGRGGVYQRVALPDHRTLAYDVRVTVRGDVSPATTCTVRLKAPDGRVLDGASVPVTEEWVRREVQLRLTEPSGSQYRGSPFGEYSLSFTVEGNGSVDLDWVMLVDGDAVAGKFNRTTVDLVRAAAVTSLRWPGGNFASQYHWRDGVGPLEERPVVPNVNWGGLERNYLGTNEFLEFCELTDVEPHLTVGFWSEIGPEEAAEWVEYVNGDRSTEMGRLRAQHGHPEPWDVRSWQVGNEVWLPSQVGNTTATAYASRYAEYDAAMKAVDPDVEITAVGIDPMYTDFHDGSGVRNFGRPPVWNRDLFDTAGPTVTGVDVHRYVRGVVLEDVRTGWLERTGGDPVGYNEVLVNFPKQFGQLLAELVETAARRGVPDLAIDVGEWNLQPIVSPGWPRAGYPTMAHAAFVAGMFNAFIRNGNAVKLAHYRDNMVFWRPYPIDFRPPSPGNLVQRTYAKPLTDGRPWHVVPTRVTGPTRTLPRTGIRIRRMTGVPLVDSVATVARGGDDDQLLVFVTNAGLRRSCTVTVDVADWPPETAGPAEARVPARLQLPADGDPFARQTAWDRLDGFTLADRRLRADADGTVDVTLPPASVARLTFSLA